MRNVSGRTGSIQSKSGSTVGVGVVGTKNVAVGRYSTGGGTYDVLSASDHGRTSGTNNHRIRMITSIIPTIKEIQSSAFFIVLMEYIQENKLRQLSTLS
jgi:hypothetical protein